MVEILYVIDTLWGVGGAEVALSRLARALPKDRYRCRIVTFNGDEHGRALFEEFGIPVHFWPISNLYGLKAFQTANRLRRLVLNERIDVVHTFFAVSDLWAGSIAKWCGVPCIISSRRDMGILRRRWHRFAYRILSPIYDQVHAVSNSVRQFTIDSDGICPDRVITCYNGVPIEQVEVHPEDVALLRNKAGIELGDIVVTCVANWRYVKGIDVLVHAASIVAKRCPRVRFLVAGEFGKSPADLAYTESVMAMAMIRNASRYMTFLGPVDCIPALLSMSHIFTLPSRSEGLSNALLEAMQAGLPSVVTKVGGNPEVVIDGLTGFVVPSESPDELAQRIIQIVQNPALRRNMGSAGRERVIQNFSIAGVLNRTMNSYEVLLPKPTRLENKTAAHRALTEPDGRP